MGIMGGDCGVASTESVLTVSVRKMDEELNRLEEVSKILFQRLKPVRNERPCLEAKSPDVPRPPKSALADTIDIFASRANAVKQAMDVVLKEIEL